MSNFEYIISSLPFLTADYNYAHGKDFQAVIDEIRGELGEKDAAALDFLLEGFREENLGEDFYARALSHGAGFIRGYFAFDLNLRNAKVRYLNRRLGRPDDQDVITGEGAEYNGDIDLLKFRSGEFEEAAKVQFVLEQEDLLTREKGLDDITWQKVDVLETFHYFDLTAVLAYVAKLHIVDRWLALDVETGREMFQKLVKQVKGTYKGVKYEQ
ncbi:MAG: DUF2764 domain-containing protein [Bacteroidales bacterium]|nr:DUF2764 domain-containing protein [Bacteroidales bacterium]